MAVVGARACLDLTLATLRPSGLATRTSSARAGRMSRGEESRLAETELASAHLKHHRLTLELSGSINREAIDLSA
jgi:hypothetical protein